MAMDAIDTATFNYSVAQGDTATAQSVLNRNSAPAQNNSNASAPSSTATTDNSNSNSNQPNTPPKKFDNTVTLTVGNTSYTGWTSVQVSRSLESFPSVFAFSASEKYPGGQFPKIAPGANCSIYFGKDLVLSGKIDSYNPSFNSHSHNVSIVGRGLCSRLVDCASDLRNQMFQIQAQTLSRFILPLIAPFGISLLQPTGDVTIDAIAVQVKLGDTPWAHISEAAQYAGMLVYESPDGKVVMSKIGTTTHKSGVKETVNVEEAAAIFDISQRFSHYYYLNMDMPAQIVGGGYAPVDPSQVVVDHAFDAGGSCNPTDVPAQPGTTTYRPRWLVADSRITPTGIDIVMLRAKWEAARRAGRSQSIHVLTDSWRDITGKLWEINTLIPVSIPTLHVTNVNWVIADVEFIFDDHGTHTNLVLMPPAALMPEPTDLYQLTQTDRAVIFPSHFPTAPGASATPTPVTASTPASTPASSATVATSTTTSAK